ncbi:MAG: hypothetical protein RLZZ15_4419 [Verrucomicrobiota bacterium]|jgi:MraZ protein
MSSTDDPFYTGEFRHSLDERDRLTVPAVWRAINPETATYFAMALNGSIALLPPAEGLRVRNLAHQKAKLGDAVTRAQAAKFFARLQPFVFDKAGRVILDKNLRDYAGIKKEAVLVGSGNTINVYSPEGWAAELALADEHDARAAKGEGQTFMQKIES